MNRLLSLSTFASAILLTSSVLAAPPAPPKFSIVDHSSEMLISPADAKAIWAENLPATVVKAYPVKSFGYVSEVNGGFDDAKTCVIVARVMMVPLNGKTFIYDPKKTSAAFGAHAGATAEQCSAMAKVKLREAVKSVASSLAN